MKRYALPIALLFALLSGPVFVLYDNHVKEHQRETDSRNLLEQKRKEEKETTKHLSFVASTTFFERTRSPKNIVIKIPIESILNWEPHEEYECQFTHANREYRFLFSSPFNGSLDTLRVGMDFFEIDRHNRVQSAFSGIAQYPKGDLILNQESYNIIAMFKRDAKKETSNIVSCHLEKN